MSKKHNLYTGRSGHLAVMAQFLSRGYNVAVPEIDVGEDLFVIRDTDGELSRVQVKAATGKGRMQAAGTFNIPMVQLIQQHDPELHYVLTLQRDGLWREFVILRRDVLKSLHEKGGIGNVANGSLLLYLAFSDTDVQCSKVSLQQYRDNWSKWPVITH